MTLPDQGNRILFPLKFVADSPKAITQRAQRKKRKGRYNTLCDLCETSAPSALRLLLLLVLPVRWLNFRGVYPASRTHPLALVILARRKRACFQRATTIYDKGPYGNSNLR